MITISKVALPAPWDGTAANDIVGEGLKNNIFGSSQWESRTKEYAKSGAFGSDTFKITAAYSEVASYDTLNTCTFFLDLYNSSEDKLFGKRSRILVVRGTGANGQPTGTITINAAFVGKLVNGAGTVAFSGLIKPLVLLITADPTTGNFTTQELNKPFAAGAAIADIAVAPTAADYNTVLARLRSAAVILP